MGSGRETVDRYYEAWNRRDADGCAACFAQDGVREGRIMAAATSPGSRFPRFVGRDAIRERLASFIEAVPDLVVEVLRVGEGAGAVWVEWHLTGTHTGDWGRWQAKGERVDVPAVSVFAIDADGLFAEEAEYIDPQVMMNPPPD